MSQMIDRVAKAIYVGRNGEGCKPWSLLTKAHREPYLKDARAAIAAVADDLEERLREGYPAAWAEDHLREALPAPLAIGRM